ncbi:MULTISPECIES: hypothetical protein [Clostridium]|uniref:Uncharacterized protein n=1 Tax=Clostridium cibarium TaxID=2762247 RepID=A0ABR8PSM6_9CLOT|nr:MULTISPECIES: hypothetical protein [Clostridium]MBD7911176.1 hypothetical protein [Clostridium cibarium]
MINEFKELVKPTVENPIRYTERATRDVRRAHFTEEMLKQVILNPKKIDKCGKNIFIVYGEKTAKMKIEIVENANLLIHWFEYNKVPFFG